MAQLVQFAPDLLQVLDARRAAKHHDYVAELAAERAAARELQRGTRIALQLDQIEAGCRRIGQRDRTCLVVQRLRRALLEVIAELLPNVFPLTSHHAVSELGILLGAQRGVAATRYDVVPTGAIVGEQFLLAWELYPHAAQTNMSAPGNSGTGSMFSSRFPPPNAQGRARRAWPDQAGD